MFYLYAGLYREFFGLVKANFKSVSEVSKFHVNSLSIVCHTYHCAIHSLPTLKESSLTRDALLQSCPVKWCRFSSRVFPREGESCRNTGLYPR